MSKSLSVRSRLVLSLSTLIEENASATAAGMAAVLRHPDPSASIPVVDVVALSQRLGSGLRSELDGVAQADRAHEVELADDVAHRAARDAAFAVLRKAAVSLRSRVHAIYGDDGLSSLVLGAPCPQTPVAAIGYARAAAAALDDVTIVLPPSEPIGGGLDRAEAARILRTHADAVDSAIATVEREDAEAKTSLTAKNAALASFDARYRKTADLAIAMWKAAGLDDVVEKHYAETRGPSAEDDEPEPPTDVVPPPAPVTPVS